MRPPEVEMAGMGVGATGIVECVSIKKEPLASCITSILEK